MTSVSVSSFSFYKHYGTFSRRKKSSKDGKSSVNSLYRVPFDSNQPTNHYISPFDSMALESFRGSREKPNLPRPSLFGSSGVFGVRREPIDDSIGVYAMFSKRSNRVSQSNEKQSKDSLKREKEGMIPAKLRSRLVQWQRGQGSEHLCRNIRRY